MLRIIVILLIAVLLLAAFLFPQFRRSLWTTLVVVLCVVAGIIWLDNRQRELQHSRLPVSQIELLHMQVKTGLNARSYVVKGRLRNQSEELTINMIVLQVTLKDCVAESCQVVGQEDRRIFFRFLLTNPEISRPLFHFLQLWICEGLQSGNLWYSKWRPKNELPL